MARLSRPSVVFVLGLAPVKIGGIEKFLRSFAIAMDRAGWNTVLCFDGAVSDLFRSYVDFPFCTIESVPQQQNLGLRAAPALWAVLRRHRPARLIYAFHGVMRCFPWVSVAAGCRTVSFYDHSSRPPEFVPGPLPLSRRLAGWFLTLPLQQIVSVSDFTRRTGTSLGLSHCPNTVLTNGVGMPSPEPARRKEFRERFGIPADAVLVSQICWMVPVKGVQTLLAAAAAVLQSAPETCFLLAGDGPELTAYRDMAQQMGIGSRVIFTGLLQNPTASGLFEATDVYCQPSLWQEACGLAVLEAMSFSLPVIVSDIGGLPEQLEDGRSGLLFPAGDAEKLADRLLQLIRDPGLRQTMGARSHELFLRDHQLEEIVERYVNLVLNGPPSSGAAA